MNHVALIGNLTRNPEAIQTKAGTAGCRFTIAVNRPSKTEQKADFIPIKAFGARGIVHEVSDQRREGRHHGEHQNIHVHGTGRLESVNDGSIGAVLASGYVPDDIRQLEDEIKTLEQECAKMQKIEKCPESVRF